MKILEKPKLILFLTLIVIASLIVFLIMNQLEQVSKNNELQLEINKQQQLAKKVESQNKIELENLTYADFNSVKDNTIKNIAPEKQNNNLDFSKLNIQLLSVAEIGKNKLANLLYNDQKIMVQKNQKIDDNLTLTEIAKDYVLVQYFTKTHRLEMDSSPNANFSSVQLVQKIDKGVQTQVVKLQKMLKADPYSLVGIIGVRNYQKSGVEGFELRPNIDKTLFKELGLVDGDVLLEINNLPVSNGLNFEKIYETLINERQFVIKVMRNGNLVEYLLNLDS